MVIGSIPVWEEDGKLQILLCKRAIEPRYGFWTLPAGFMENNETTEQAAKRETEEEAGANIELQGLFSLLNVPHVHQVHMFYRAK
jgi:ADP-ribose pyrophosphatase YjhB (NUDIX family)